jgi:hypothetical protein
VFLCCVCCVVSVFSLLILLFGSFLSPHLYLCLFDRARRKVAKYQTKTRPILSVFSRSRCLFLSVLGLCASLSRCRAFSHLFSCLSFFVSARILIFSNRKFK